MKHVLLSIAAGLTLATASSHAALFLDAASLAESETFALDPRFDALGMISYNYQGNWYEQGSATLIAPDWILTAGHITKLFLDYNAANDPLTVCFSLGHDGLIPVDFAIADLLITNPGYSPGNQGFGPDLRLIHLSTPITSVAAAVRFRGTDPASSFRHQYFMAGYGRPGVYPNPLNTDDAIKRAGSNTIVFLGSESHVNDDNYMLSTFSPGGVASFLEWKGTPGDSGGGWFMDVNGEWQLAAVTAYVTGGVDTTGRTAGVRLSQNNAWIDETIRSVPEPSALMLGGIGLAYFGLRRGRTAMHAWGEPLRSANMNCSKFDPALHQAKKQEWIKVLLSSRQPRAR